MFAVGIEEGFTAPVVVDWSTSPGTASDEDYTPVGGEITFDPNGPFSYAVSVQTLGDCLVEPDEDFYVNLSGNHSPGGAPSQILIGQAMGRIVDAPCTAEFPETMVLQGTADIVDDVSWVDFGSTTPSDETNREGRQEREA